jgi:TolA-binding protein
MGEDRARGARALETVVVTWPDTPQAREANSRLGDIRVSANDKAGAVAFYAAALKDWPRIGWAADTTLKLADALFATDRKTQGCAALAEFTRRYAPSASDPQKARAAQMKTAGGCS